MTQPEQLSFAALLPPLGLRNVVRTPAGWIGEVVQVWPGHDYYVVFAFRLPMHKPLPTYRRDELEIRPEEERAEVWKR